MLPTLEKIQIVDKDFYIFHSEINKVRVRITDKAPLIDFIDEIINRYTNDCGILANLKYKNKRGEEKGKIRLLWSAYYKYENNIEIDTLMTGEPNDTLTFFNGKKKITTMSINFMRCNDLFLEFKERLQ